jgi:WD40 repeat protein
LVWDEESGELHRDLEGFEAAAVSALATFLSPDGQQARLVAGWSYGPLRVYVPEAGSLLHHVRGHTSTIVDVACIASSSPAPHLPRLVSASLDGTAKVWDGETGEMLADLRGHTGTGTAVAVWKEHTGEGEHDRIATSDDDGWVRVWDGEAFTPLHDLDCGGHAITRVIPLKSSGGGYRLMITAVANRGLQVWDPEEGRLLHDELVRGSSPDGVHFFKSAGGRQLLALVGCGTHHPRHRGDTRRAFLDVWDMGEAPARDVHIRPANRLG